MEKIFVFGHRKPDTDSVAASITLANLKKQLGYNAIPCVLGDINNETKFVLDYFNVKPPKYLNDVKLQIKDLNFQKNHLLEQHESIYNGYLYMNHYHISTLPIISEKNKFVGAISMKDIAKDLINGDFDTLNTSYDNIVNALEGEEVLRFDNEIQGHIFVASYRSTTFMETIAIDNDSILIVGDRHSIIEYAILNNVKLIILTGDSKIKDDHLKLAQEKKINIIKTNFRTFKVSRRIGLSNYISTIVNKNVIVFDENEQVNDFIEIANRTKHSNYPIINQKKECLGFLKLADAADRKKKKVILVDHNEYEQSVDGLEEAEIVEIIDHHKIGTIGTTVPINFRNMPVGSTNTIISILYKENSVEITPTMAGLMMAGILSDTLLFKSPTTTETDKKIVEELAGICNIDYREFAYEMFKAGSSLTGKTLEEILYTDFKNFDIDNKKIGISQISTIDINSINEHKDEYIELIEKIAKNNDYYVLALFITDIINDGSYILFNKNAKEILENSFDVINLEQGHYFDGMVSRKKQIIPCIMNYLDHK